MTLQKFWQPAVLLCALIAAVPAANAQLDDEDGPWLESTVPPAPSFSTDKLVPFEVSAGSELSFGIDPATLSVSRQDGVVRYVMVATSRSGAKNVVYEGIRCSKGEVRTYARNHDGKWSETTGSAAEWRSMFLGNATKPALRLAQAGVCDNATVTLTPRDIVERMRSRPGIDSR